MGDFDQTYSDSRKGDFFPHRSQVMKMAFLTSLVHLALKQSRNALSRMEVYCKCSFTL